MIVDWISLGWFAAVAAWMLITCCICGVVWLYVLVRFALGCSGL